MCPRLVDVFSIDTDSEDEETEINEEASLPNADRLVPIYSVHPKESSLLDTTLEYALAVPKGIVSGVKQWVHSTYAALTHPLDEVIYPIGRFLNDSYTLSTGYGDIEASFTAMNERGAVLGNMYKAVEAASGPQRLQTATSVITEIFANKGVIKTSNGVFHRFEGLASGVQTAAHGVEGALEFAEAHSVLNLDHHVPSIHSHESSSFVPPSSVLVSVATADIHTRMTLETIGASQEFFSLRDAIYSAPTAVPAAPSLSAHPAFSGFAVQQEIPSSPDIKAEPSLIGELSEAAHRVSDLIPMVYNSRAQQEVVNNLTTVAAAIAAAPGVADIVEIARRGESLFTPSASLTPNPPTPPTLSPCALALRTQELNTFLTNTFCTSFLRPEERNFSLFSERSDTSGPVFRDSTMDLLNSLSLCDLYGGTSTLRIALERDPFLHRYIPSSGLAALQQRIISEVTYKELGSLIPSLDSALWQANFALGRLGLGLSLSTGSFYDMVRSSGLVGSYRSFNPDANVERVFEFLCKLSGREPGGIEQKVGLITDLINDPVHEASDFTFCFPTQDGRLPCSKEQLQQIAREVATGFYTHNALPFFSLDFGNSGAGKSYLVPQIHPVYANTLTGKIISILDYYLKCLLNGVYFEQAFLEEWFKSMNEDSAFLRKFAFDLKDYCTRVAPHLNYLSLRELMKKRGLDAPKSDAAYKQPFMTSFRIIAKTRMIERQGNVLIPHPDFEIAYSIDLMPDYEAYINQYHRTHGEYPPDYEATKQCYAEYAGLLKGYLHTLPLTRTLMDMLGVINFFGYFYSTLKAMGKMPALPPKPVAERFATPPAFPPLPVRYYQAHPLALTWGELLARVHHIEASAALKPLDKELEALFDMDSDLSALPATIIERIKEAVTQLMMEKLNPLIPSLTPATLNGEEVDYYTRVMSNALLNSIQETKASFESTVDTLTSLYAETFGEDSNPRTLSALQEITSRQKEAIRVRWEADSSLASHELFALIPKEEHKNMKRVLDEEERTIKSQIEGDISEFLADKEQFVLRKEAEIKADFDERIRLSPDDTAELTAQCEEGLAGFRQLCSLEPSIVLEQLNARAFEARPMYLTQVAIGLYEDWIDHHLKKLSPAINQLSHHLLRNKKWAGRPMSTEQYCHSQTSFDSSDYNKDGLKIEIKGGCAVSVPNLKSRPLARAERLHDALARGAVDYEEWQIIVHEGTTYAATKMPVKKAFAACVTDYNEFSVSLDNPKACTVDELSEVKAFLDALFREPTTKPKIPLALLTKELDVSGAKAIHYAATLFKASSLDALIALDKEQLKHTDTLGFLPIHTAAAKGNCDAINVLHAHYRECVNAVSEKGLTPLVLAIQHGQMDAVELLLTLGANPNYQLPNNLFPLYIALQNRFTGIAALLADKVADSSLNTKLANGMTALHLAIEYRLFAVAERLIKRGAPFTGRRKSDGLTPFHIAVSANALDLVTLMLARGGVVNEALDSGKTALHLAAEGGHSALITSLLSAGATPEAATLEGDTPCMLALKAGHKEAAQLLALVSPVNHSNKQQETASLLAARATLWPIVDSLISRGEDPNTCDSTGVNCVYHLIVGGEYDRVARLLEEGRIDCAQVINGYSLTALAAQQGQAGLFALLEAQKAPFATPYTSNPDLYLPIMAVCTDEEIELRRWLAKPVSERGFEHIIPLGPHQGKSMAYLAAEQGSTRCLKRMRASLSEEELLTQKVLIAAIKKGIVAHVQLCLPKDSEQALDAEGNNALHYATLFGSRVLVEELVHCGLKTNTANKKGQTPFHLCIANDDAYLLKRLLKLTPKAAWPTDLHTAVKMSTSKAVLELLEEKGYVFAGAKATPEDKAQAVAEERERALARMSNYPQLARRVQGLLRNHNWAGIHRLVRRHVDLGLAFREDAQTLVGAIIHRAHPPVVEEGEEAHDEVLLILRTLKAQGMKLEQYLGAANCLLKLRACAAPDLLRYRFSLLEQSFSDAIPALMADSAEQGLIVARTATRYAHSALSHAHMPALETTPLFEAIRAGHYALAHTLADEHNVHARTSQLQTPLMLAAARGNKLLLQRLIDCGAEVDAVDGNGDSALHYALRSNAVNETALHLLPFAKEPNKANRQGITVLMFAAAKGAVQVIHALCSRQNYTTEVSAEGCSALHYAALEGQLDAIKALVAHGFAVNQPENPPGASKKSKCVKRTPLHLAARLGKTAAVLQLFALGACAVQKDELGYSVFEHALLSKNKELWRALKPLLATTYTDQQSSLFIAAAECDHIELVMELLVAGLDCNITERYGNSALHIAADHNSLRVLHALLARSHLLNYQNHQGQTALHSAAKKGHVAAIDLLVEAKAELNKKDSEGATPLFLACKEGHLAAVLCLTRHGADTLMSNSEGLTPAQCALANGHREIVHSLIKEGDVSLMPQHLAFLPKYLQAQVQRQPLLLAEYQGLCIAVQRASARARFFASTAADPSPVSTVTATPLGVAP